MLGQLPTKLDIGGVSCDINPDFRNVLQIIDALNDTALSDGEKTFILLRRLYPRFDMLPRDRYADAVQAAFSFIECGKSGDKKKRAPKVVDWGKDEQLIFAAVNKVAGREVRTEPFLHWWTFLGYYQSVDREDLFSFVISIRQKKARCKKLEKYETEFYNANREMCDIAPVVDRKKEAEDYMAALYAELTAEAEAGAGAKTETKGGGNDGE